MSSAGQRALVIGCGVSGLTCGLSLAEDGYDVRIVTRRMPLETTSAVAAAIWYPYRAFPADKVALWGFRSLDCFREIAADPASGVSLVDLYEVFLGEAPAPDWRIRLEGFRTLRPRELPQGYGSGFCLHVPFVETPAYLPWILERFRQAGGTVEKSDHGVRSLDELRGEADLVVNCAGLGARELCGDHDLRPIRGQLVSVEPIDRPYAVVDDDNPMGPAYVIPRSHDCILGTTTEVDDWSEEPRESATDQILSRAAVIEPAVAGRRILGVRVGLRPGRSAVRVEGETLSDGTRLVHNYGHGGAGVSLSWGCADEVVALAKA